MPYTYTPLRYPGGKNHLAGFLRDVIKANGLRTPHYVEPYCGGAGAALNLLLSEVVSDIHLNDIDRGVHAFWMYCLKDSEGLCDRIAAAKLTVREWERQKAILREPRRRPSLELAFATLYLNRVNRSGILRGGLIGGREQAGRWKMGARFNRDGLIGKVRQIARNRHRIHVYGMDALAFLRQLRGADLGPTLVYLDPPYVNKGGLLYENHYTAADHTEIARVLKSEVGLQWVVSYDRTPLIQGLYAGMTRLAHKLSYSAHQERRRGREIVILGPGVKAPPYARPRDARPAPVKIAAPARA